jgi:hypothetical protein
MPGKRDEDTVVDLGREAPRVRLRWFRERQRQRFASRRRMPRARSYLRRNMGLILSLALAAGLIGWGLWRSPFDAPTTLRHWAAAPDCAAARAMGLAPSRPGEPGYYVRHDRDLDGKSCEPFVR